MQLFAGSSRCLVAGQQSMPNKALLERGCRIGKPHRHRCIAAHSRLESEDDLRFFAVQQARSVGEVKMGYKVAVVGATGNVGREVLGILAERNFPADEVVPLAS